MLLNDLHIKIHGLDDSDSKHVATSLEELIHEFDNLDLRRLDKIVVTTTFERDIESLTTSRNAIFKNRYRSNRDTYAIVLTLPKRQEFELVLVLKANFALNLIPDYTDSTMQYKDALHILHHELSHVHDNNQKIDAFKDDMLNSSYKGKHAIFYPLAETCWSEYVANYISSSSGVDSKFPKLVAISLGEKIKACEFNIKTEKLAYRTNNNREDLLQSMQDEITSLLKTAAYTLGYMHGMNVSLAELSDETDYIVETTYFKDIWEVMIYGFHTIREVYPHGWVKLEIYDSLAFAFEAFFNQLGIIILEDENQQISFKIV